MKIQRKYMAHYLNAAFSDPEAKYVRLGRDLEEYAPELSANVRRNPTFWARPPSSSTATRSRAR